MLTPGAPVFALLMLLSVAMAMPAHAARRAELSVAHVDAGVARIDSLRIVVRETAPEDQRPAAPRLSLRLRAARLEVPALDVALGDLAWDCDALRTVPGAACEGPLRIDGRAAGRLAVDLSGARTDARWSQGARAVGLAKDAASPWQVDVQRIPLAWLQAFLATLWPDGAVGSGTVSGRVGFPVDPGDPAATVIDAALRLEGLGFDTPDGQLAGAGLDAPLDVRYASRGDDVSLALSVRPTAGELLLGPVYLVVPPAGLALEVQASSQPEGGWRLPRWSWRDPGVLEVAGGASFGPEGGLRALSAEARAPDLAVLGTRYLAGVLASAGFGDLQLAGRASGALAFDADGLSALTVALEDTHAIDPKGRFSLAGVAGDLRWSRDAAVADSGFAWRAAALYGIGVDAGALAFRSEAGRLVLAEPLRTGALGGHVRLDRFVWRPPRGAAPLRIEMGLALEALDLGSLAQRLGWPDFKGTIAGTLPNALYERNRVSFEGGLAMQLFGGEVRIDDLALERPFGVAPSLAANVRFQDIDLAPLTGAFGFGEITGRLDGRIRDLRLVDWTPVAFDARLLTDRNWEGSRRISQRAVQDISDLGGSGLVAGLQARLLRTFDDFGYDRIGIGCVLRDDRCAMTGLKKRGDGYVIIEGRGLPRIEVVGFRRSVDWPTLVERLRDATEGDTLRID